MRALILNLRNNESSWLNLEELKKLRLNPQIDYLIDDFECAITLFSGMSINHVIQVFEYLTTAPEFVVEVTNLYGFITSFNPACNSIEEYSHRALELYAGEYTSRDEAVDHFLEQQYGSDLINKMVYLICNEKAWNTTYNFIYDEVKEEYNSYHYFYQ